jgi:hypothetical protein
LRVLRGGSAEVESNKWFKFDIELDESDLQAIVIKNNLDSDKLTVGQKYQLLVTQAELLVTLQMEGQGSTGTKTSREILSEFNTLIEKMPHVDSV